MTLCTEKPRIWLTSLYGFMQSLHHREYVSAAHWLAAQGNIELAASS